MTATARLEARISPDLRDMLRRAAELEGRTMTDFVIAAVSDAAKKTIAENDIVRLSVADQKVFAQAILNPPAPTDAMKRAAARHKTLVKP